MRITLLSIVATLLIQSGLAWAEGSIDFECFIYEQYGTSRKAFCPPVKLPNGTTVYELEPVEVEWVNYRESFNSSGECEEGYWVSTEDEILWQAACDAEFSTLTKKYPGPYPEQISSKSLAVVATFTNYYACVKAAINYEAKWPISWEEWEEIYQSVNTEKCELIPYETEPPTSPQ